MKVPILLTSYLLKKPYSTIPPILVRPSSCYTNFNSEPARKKAKMSAKSITNPTTYETFSFVSQDGFEITTHVWKPSTGPSPSPRTTPTPKAVIQIAHGMAEHALRYREFAEFLNQAGYAVYANDHRGHGQSALSKDEQGWLGPERGFELLIEDMLTLTKLIRQKHPETPLFLFGHSMGSFATQRFIIDYPGQVDGVILSGSNGKQGLILSLGLLVAKIDGRIRGTRTKSNILNKLSFGTYNKHFAPNRTEYDWLTRDEQAVDKYATDPSCGEVFPIGFYVEFFETLRYIEDKANIAKIPHDLPILILSGSEDPVGNFGKGVAKLHERYKRCGVKDLELKLYEGARHELLNETNREEVMHDILSYLDARI